MKKRTAAIGALVLLLPLGQPLVMGTCVALTSAGVILTVPNKAKAETAKYYFDRGFEKAYEKKDNFGAIADYTKAININPKYWDAYYFRALSKVFVQDYFGSIFDLNKIIDDHPTYYKISNGAIYASRGWAKYMLGNRNDACADWREALRKGTKDAAEWVKESC